MAAVTYRRQGVAGESGNAVIEMALTLPLLLVVLLGIIDFGFLFQRYEVVTNAAREGARIGVLPGYSDEDIQARVVSYLSAGGLTNPPTTNDVQRGPIALPTGGTMTGVQVTVGYPHTFVFVGPIAQFFGGTLGTVDLTARSTMRAEMQAVAGP